MLMPLLVLYILMSIQTWLCSLSAESGIFVAVFDLAAAVALTLVFAVASDCRAAASAAAAAARHACCVCSSFFFFSYTTLTLPPRT